MYCCVLVVTVIFWHYWNLFAFLACQPQVCWSADSPIFGSIHVGAVLSLTENLLNSFIGLFPLFLPSLLYAFGAALQMPQVLNAWILVWNSTLWPSLGNSGRWCRQWTQPVKVGYVKMRKNENPKLEGFWSVLFAGAWNTDKPIKIIP